MAKAEEEKIEEVVEKPKGRSKKLVIIILAVLLVVLIGGGGVVYLLLTKPASEGAQAQAKHEDDQPPIYEKLDTFTVNLADQQSYLQVEIQFQVSDPEIQEKIKQHMPEVRDALIRLLSSKLPADLATQQGKDSLADDIKKQANGILAVKEAGKGVKKVLFNSFIIQ
jgi:flagellar FliL protein